MSHNQHNLGVALGSLVLQHLGPCTAVQPMFLFFELLGVRSDLYWFREYGTALDGNANPPS